ncbi:MAG: hypothetical protein BWZ08_02706 [candidate division BRC1 bacterium ADurb.BinA292]|nr:MAG: hypothetical protein BWZ08_02706 [candidate division BRC1 bacterium ADurb.BinA292]
MLGLERRAQVFERLGGDFGVVQGAADFRELPLVTHIGAGGEHDAVGRVSLALKAFAHRALHLAANRLDRIGAERVAREQAAPDIVVFDIGEQEAGGAEQPRQRGNDHLEHLQFARQAGGLDRPRAAEGDQHILAGIAAALGRDLAQRPHRDGIGDAVDPLRRLEQVEPEGAGNLVVDRAARRFDVHVDVALGQPAGPDVAQHGVGVGQRRRGAAAPVADGPRQGAGAARADVQAAGAVQIGDAAAAGAHFGDVDRRHADQFARAADQPAAARQAGADLILGAVGDAAVLDH